MSELYTFQAINRGSDWVDLRVRMVHPDAGPFPESPGFGLQLLLAAAHSADEPTPLKERVADDDWYDADLALERAKGVIDSVEVPRVRNAPFSEESAHARTDERVLARGIARDGEGWEKAWHEEWNEYWEAEDGPPVALYRIRVTDPRYLEGLPLGTTIDTAAWCPKGPYVGENRSERLPTPADALLPADRVDFPLAHVPHRVMVMNRDWLEEGFGLTRLDRKAERALVVAHEKFLASGGEGGEWTMLSINESPDDSPNLPMCVYTGAEAEEGEQLVLRMKELAPGASLADANLAYSDFSAGVCVDVSFRGATLDKSAAIDAVFDGSDFGGASLRGVDFSRSSMKRCKFGGAKLRGADFEQADLTGADFTGADVSGARFPGAILDRIKR